MKHLFTFLSLLLLGTTYGQSNFGEIQGTVLDEKTKDPIPFANVFVNHNGKTIGAQTNLDGKFKIKPISAGSYDIQFSTVEYTNKKLQGVDVKIDQITFLGEVHLNNNQLNDVVIYSEKLIDPFETSKVNISAKNIKNSPNRTNLNRLVGDGNSNVKVSQDGQEIYFRGSRNGDVIYLVDGVKSNGGKPMLPSKAINKLAVYTGGVPAKYGDTMGGVVVIETKSFFDLYYESKRN